MTRQEANRKLVSILQAMVEAYPDQRFGQLLCNYFIPEYYEGKDPFFTESEETLSRFKEVHKK